MRLFDVSAMVNAGFVRPGSSPLFFTLEPGKPAQGLPRSTRLGPFYALTLSGIFFLLVTKIGASEGIRTLDIHLGKVTLYQTELRSLPNKRGKIKPTRLNCKPVFPP